MHFFHDFKSFRSAQLNLFQPVTLVIGKNGSGKTNAIEAVELLANLAHGRPLYEITDIGRGSGGFEIRGGLTGCPRAGAKSFALEFSGSIKFLGQNEDFDYKIKIQADTSTRVAEESLELGDRMIFSATPEYYPKNDLLRVQYDNFARGGNKPSISWPSDRSGPVSL